MNLEITVRVLVVGFLTTSQAGFAISQNSTTEPIPTEPIPTEREPKLNTTTPMDSSTNTSFSTSELTLSPTIFPSTGEASSSGASTNSSIFASQSTSTTSVSLSTSESSSSVASTTGSSPNNSTAQRTGSSAITATATVPMPMASTISMNTTMESTAKNSTSVGQSVSATPIYSSTSDTSTSLNSQTAEHTDKISTSTKVIEGTASPPAEESTTSSNDVTQTQSQADVASTASVNTETTPGRNCEDGEKVESCTCKNGVSADGYCAKPCSKQYVWCPDSGTTCQQVEGSASEFLCTCKVGFFSEVTEEGPSCQSGKFFGGKLVFTGTGSDNETVVRTNSIDILNNIYSISSPYYVGCEILDVEQDNTVVTYQLTYKDVDSVNETSVKRTFENSTNCTKGSTVEYSSYNISCTESTENVGNQTILCDSNSSNFSGECVDTTALCNVDPSGFFFCSCKKPATYAKPSPDATSCIKIKCSQDKDCGTAGEGQCSTAADPLDNVCQCSFGFSGDNCEDAWELIFTIVTAVLGALLIVVLTACICQSRNKKNANYFESPNDADVKSPFIDFQPGIVRAQNPNVYSTVSDPSTAREVTTQGYDNGAYDSKGANGSKKIDEYTEYF